jgi:hypothetical protein
MDAVAQRLGVARHVAGPAIEPSAGDSKLDQ